MYMPHLLILALLPILASARQPWDRPPPSKGDDGPSRHRFRRLVNHDDRWNNRFVPRAVEAQDYALTFESDPSSSTSTTDPAFTPELKVDPVQDTTSTSASSATGPDTTKFAQFFQTTTSTSMTPSMMSLEETEATWGYSSYSSSDMRTFGAGADGDTSSAASSTSSPIDGITTSTGSASTGPEASEGPLELDHSVALDGEGWHFPYLALWNDTAPTMLDVKQVRIANCWLPASSIAIVNLFPQWITNLITYPDGSPMTGQSFPSAMNVSVRLWDPNRGALTSFSNINIYNVSTTEDNPGGVWWHSAITQSIQRMAQTTEIFGIYPNGTFKQTEGSPAYVMAMLTGRTVNNRIIQNYTSAHELFEHLGRGSKTPMVVSTAYNVKKTYPEIVSNHDYAILGIAGVADPAAAAAAAPPPPAAGVGGPPAVKARDGEGAEGDTGASSSATDATNGFGPGDSRTVTVQNPWGATVTFRLRDIWENCYFVYSMEDESPLVWDGEGQGGR